MNLIRIRHTVAGQANWPGTGQPKAGHLKPRWPHLARWSGSIGSSGRFIEDVEAAVTAAADRNWPAPATANPRRRFMTGSLVRPHTVQLCIHCRQNPAGFWVSHTSDQTVRRPWCLSCCQSLAPGRYHLNPFDS